MGNIGFSLGTGLFEGLSENIEQGRKDRLKRAELEGQITGAGGTVPQRAPQSGIRKLFSAVGVANQGGPNIEDLIRIQTQQAALEKRKKQKRKRFDQIIKYIDSSDTREIDTATMAGFLSEFQGSDLGVFLKPRLVNHNKKIQAEDKFTQILQDSESSRKDKIKAIIGLKRLKGETLSRQDVFGKAQQGFTLGPGQTRFGPQGEEIAQGQEKAPQGFTLGAGQTRFDAEGKEMATGGERTPTPLNPSVRALNEARTDAARALAEQRRSPVSKAVTMGQLGQALNAALRAEIQLDGGEREEARETILILIREIKNLGGSARDLVDSDLVEQLPADETDLEEEAIFDSPEAVINAIKSGEITRAQGRQILIDDFGAREKR